jgi:DNA-directed RNA polymerase subunit RPC12/RpoP
LVQDPAAINEVATHAAGTETSLLAGLTSEKDMICMLSGRVIKGRKHSAENTVRCGRCRHQILIGEIGQTAKNDSMLCPLCHAQLPHAGETQHCRSHIDQ